MREVVAFNWAGDELINLSSSYYSKHAKTPLNGLSVIDDDDSHVELEFYQNFHLGGLGDPLSNGLGHRVCWFEGVYGVVVRGAPIKRIRKLKEALVDKSYVHDDGMFQVSANQFNETAADICVGSRLAGASGP